MGHLSAERRTTLWLLAGMLACLGGQLAFHLRLGVFDGLVLYAIGAVALWRSQRGQGLAQGALALAPALTAASQASKTRWLRLGAVALALTAVLMVLQSSLRIVPVQTLVVVAGILWVWAAHAVDGPLRQGLSAGISTVSLRHWLGLAAVLSTALAVRLWDLGTLPVGLWYDEAQIGLEAWRLLTDADFRPVYSEGTTTPAAYIYLVSWSEALFGKSVFAIRLVSALSGVLSTALMYVTARLAFGPRVGLTAAALFAVARWDLNFSRIAMQGATTPMLTLFVASAGLGALRTGRRSLYALLGIGLGALVWFYTSNVFMAAVMLVALGSLAAGQFSAVRAHRNGLGIAALGALLIVMPVVASTLVSPEQILNRPQQASVFSGAAPDEVPGTLWGSAVKHAGMFNVAGDRNGRHNLPNAPMLDAVTAAFMVAGLMIALVRWRDPRYLLLLAWLPLMLLPGVLSVAFEAPQGLRSIGAVVPAVLLAAVGVAAMTARLRPETGNLIALVVIMIAAGLNVGTYFVLQKQDSRVWADFSMGATVLAQQALAAGDTRKVYGSVHYAAHPTVRFLTDKAVTQLDPDQHLPVRDTAGATLVFAAEEPVYYALTAAYYPDAGCQAVTRATPAEAVAYTCTVPAEMVAASRGLHVTVASNGAPLASGESFVVPTGAFVLPQAQGVQTISAMGSLLISQEGDYRFGVTGAAALRLLVDGRPVAAGDGAEGTIPLAQGLHTLELTGRAESQESAVRLLWAAPGQDGLAVIPPEALYHGTVRPMGLRVEYRNGNGYTVAPALGRVEPSPYVYYHVPPLERPFTAEWTGSLVAPVSGAYRFRAAGITSAELEIDGTPVVNVGGPQGPEAALELTKGLHRLRVRHLVAGSYGHFYLQWQPPGQQTLERLPPESLQPW